MPEIRTDELVARGWWTGFTGGATVELVPGVTAPAEVTAGGPAATAPPTQIGVTDDPGFGINLELTATYEADLSHYTLSSLTMTTDPWHEVTGTLLRAIAPLTILTWVVLPTLQVAARVSPYVQAYISPRVDRAASGPTLADAAAIYRLADMVRDAPAKAVADTLGLQTRTATNWITRAREAGLLAAGSQADRRPEAAPEVNRNTTRDARPEGPGEQRESKR